MGTIQNKPIVSSQQFIGSTQTESGPRLPSSEAKPAADQVKPDGFDGSSKQTQIAQRLGGHTFAVPGSAQHETSASKSDATIRLPDWWRSEPPNPHPSRVGVQLQKDGRLVVQGGKGDDEVQLEQKNGTIFVTAGGNKPLASFPVDRVKSIDVRTGAGNDRVTLIGIDAGIARVATGAGRDQIRVHDSRNVNIKSGSGNDGVIIGTSQNVKVRTGAGNDTVRSFQNQNLRAHLGAGRDGFNDYGSKRLYAHGGDGADSFQLYHSKNAHINGGRGGPIPSMFPPSASFGPAPDRTLIRGGENVTTQNTNVYTSTPRPRPVPMPVPVPVPVRPPVLPSKIKTETPDFGNYVANHRDLELAWQDMRGAGTTNANHGVYAQTYGLGLSEQGFIDQWNRLGGKQITDIGQLSKEEWGMLHYQLHGQKEGRKIPTKVVEEAPTASAFSNYVLNNPDLRLAYAAMTRDGTLTDAQMNEYKATYGKGLNEQHFIDGWNRLHPQKPITDVGQLSQAEWGFLHYNLHGRSEGRTLKKSIEQIYDLLRAAA